MDLSGQGEGVEKLQSGKEMDPHQGGHLVGVEQHCIVGGTQPLVVPKFEDARRLIDSETPGYNRPVTPAKGQRRRHRTVLTAPDVSLHQLQLLR